MAKDVIMPVLGMNQDSAVLVEWRAREGDTVVEGEPLMEVETDKAVMEIDAPASGTLVDVTAADGDDVPVGSVIARILADGEAPPPPAEDAGEPASREATGSGPAPATLSGATPRDAAPPPEPAASAPSVASLALERRQGPRTPASPLARRTAGERGLDLDALAGSGPHGAVLMRDVPEAADEAEAQAAGETASATPSVVTEAPAVAAAQAELERRVDASRLFDLLQAAGDVPVAAAIARFLAAVVTRRLGIERSAGLTLEVRGPDGSSRIAHAERRTILALAEALAADAAEDPAQADAPAGAPDAVLVHAGDVPIDAVRPHAATPVALGLARPLGGTTLVLTLRYRPDAVADALALTMIGDLADLVDDPSVLAVAF